jgi:NACalpha-BTF3-like transcription factor
MAVKRTTAKKKKKPVDKQRKSTGKGRDGAGRFARGNALGFQPGRSGNPSGRPKSRTLSEAYRIMLKQPLPEDPSRTYADAVAETLCRRAVFMGDVVAAKELADRTEGKPKQTIDVSLEERKREMVEDAIAALVEQAKVSREEAIEQLTAIAPEMSDWIN